MAITPGGRVGDASPLGKGKRRLSDYEREVAHALMRHGHDKRSAIRIARGVIDKAAATGRWGKGRAKPNVRAGAVASVGQRVAMHSHANEDTGDIELARNPMNRMVNGTRHRETPVGIVAVRGNREVHLIGTSVNAHAKARHMLATQSFDKLYRTGKKHPRMKRVAFHRLTDTKLSHEETGDTKLSARSRAKSRIGKVHPRGKLKLPEDKRPDQRQARKVAHAQRELARRIVRSQGMHRGQLSSLHHRKPTHAVERGGMVSGLFAGQFANPALHDVALSVARKRDLDLGMFSEALHPRDVRGRFAHGGGAKNAKAEAKKRLAAVKTPTLNPDTVKDFRGGSAEKHLVAGPNGTQFTPERQKLHDDIVRKIIGDHPVAQEHPAMIFTGGGPASGKTAVTDQANKDFPNAITINPDDIKAMLPEYHTMSRDKAAGHVHEESSYLAKRVTAEALKSKAHVILDAVGDNSADNMRKKIKQARDAGYAVHGRYITVPTQVAQERAHARGVKTGRVVNPDAVQTLHTGVSRVFPEIAPEFDTATLHDNTTSPVKVVSYKEGKRTVHNRALHGAFLAKASEPSPGEGH